ncbi:hypothetical protein HMPREF2835_02715 [Actinomyces sp. HMSC072A03]|nr:hypothetical protein HMPREF2835_02715 [Actinomyces sp. HMSC072A03]
MAAAARDGAQVLHLGTHGTGFFGDLVRSAMRDEGITVALPVTPGQDTGFCIALTDAQAERTFVSTVGAEAEVTKEQLGQVRLFPEDVVYLSGYSFVHPKNCKALMQWLPTVPAGQIVLDVSPVVADIPDIGRLLRLSSVVSANERELEILSRRTQLAPAALAQHFQVSVLARAGASGTTIYQPQAYAPVHVGAPAVTAVDSNGAGDAHAGVFCSSLLAGLPLVRAVKRANVAGALTVTRRGPATSPTRAQIERTLDGNRL